MLPSETLELKIFDFAESAGKARWRAVDLGTLENVVQYSETAVLVDALIDLHARHLMEFRQWSYEQNGWVSYVGQDPEYFDRPFQVRVTFPGRKYFERLGDMPAQLAPATTEPPRIPEVTFQGLLEGAAPEQATAHLIAPPPSMPPTAFVSHSGQDRDWVERFVRDLWAVGIKAWYFPWEIKPGDPIRQKIEEGLAQCEFFIIVISKGSLTRPWVQKELDVAADRKLQGRIQKIIPIKIDQCDQLPPFLQTFCWEDFTNQSYESALKRVQDSIFGYYPRPLLGQKSKETKDGHHV